MKKAILTLVFTLFLISFISGVEIKVHSLNNQDMYITPIKTTSNFEKIEKTKLLTTNNEGIVMININIDEPFHLAINLTDRQKTSKIFRETFEDTKTNIIKIFPKEKEPFNFDKILINNKKDLPRFVITGFAIYSENKNLIIPIYYSLIAFLSMIVIFNIIFKKTKSEGLIEEAEELLNNEKLKEAEKNLKNAQIDLDEIKNDVGPITKKRETEHKEEMESIPEIETDYESKEMEEKIKEEETSVDEKEMFKESEEKLESEIKEEIKEDKKNPEPKSKKGQPSPLNVDTGEKENSKKLINEAKELEKE